MPGSRNGLADDDASLCLLTTEKEYQDEGRGNEEERSLTRCVARCYSGHLQSSASKRGVITTMPKELKEPKPPTERTWMRLGATREQARRLLAIPNVEVTEAQCRAALFSHRATNMWPGAIQWLNTGCVVVSDGEFFYRDIES